VLAGMAGLLLVYALIRGARAGWLRTLVMVALLGYLAGPTLIEEERRYHNDVAVVVIDESVSQGIGDRAEQTRQARAALEERVAGIADLDLKVVTAGPRAGGPADGTMLLQATQKALETVPRDRLAGVVMLTDGLVHDLPEDQNRDLFGAPLHVLLTGRDMERDRRIEIVSSPAYGLVKQRVVATLKVHDATLSNGLIPVQVRRDGVHLERRLVPVNRTAEFDLPIDHGGANIFEFEVARGARELTLENNRAALSVNGVRDRLRVLLVSGEPYSGERSWRNLLKADPAVDLVHFTILRPPQKQDATPIHELALIAFPIRELFELKIKDFDLIIFDRFWRQGVLHFAYLNNIARYVMEGGALLDAAGPSFAGPGSLYSSPLSKVLPGAPTGDVTVEGFRPRVSDLGKRHPVTLGLTPGPAARPWGRWFRQVDIEAPEADVLMEGAGGRPLLVLDRVGEGRVAQLLSDQAWLWARGFEGGGPQAEIFRRTAHWLMKEPALEEERLSARAEGGTIRVERRSLQAGARSVRVTGPDGESQRVQLQEGNNGIAFGQLQAEVAGLYRFSDGEFSSIAVVGSLNPLEFAELVSTPSRLSGHVAASNGGILRLQHVEKPKIRRVDAGERSAGADWIGLVENRSFDVASLKRAALMPPWAALLILLALLGAVWRREGR